MIIHMMNCLWKSLKGYRKILVVVLSVALALEFPYLGEKDVKAATVVYENIEGRDGDYTYSLWKDTGDTTMTINGNGQFECEWENINNALFREGIKFDCTRKYDEIGNITVEYGVDYQPDGNSYMCIYGWSRDPLIEYYIVDSWGTWRPPGFTSKGKIEVDGGKYDVYETIRENQPSIDGNTTFKQYWSVRTSKRTEGIISVTEHFKAWEKLGLNLGKLYEACLCIEGYQSNGKAKVYLNKVTVGGEVSKDDNNSKDTGPARPKIMATLTGDDSIKLTIKKTENASGYRIYVKKPGTNKYVKLKTVSKNGKKVRTYTFEPTDEGTYTFKVKAYKKVDGKKVWGSASKSVKVTVE